MNNKIEPHYVAFATAKWLKEKGFDVPCNKRFWVGFENEEYFQGDCISNNWNDYDDSSTTYYSAPEQWQVCEWLRVNHGIHIGIDAWLQEDGSNQGYDYCVYKTWKDKIDYELKLLNSSTQIKLYNTPQSAYAAAFDYIKDNNLI
jgi:hypothetical protein